MRSIINLIKKTYHLAGPQESKAVLHNVASLSWLQGVTYLLPIIILPYLFRVIGPEKFGLIFFAQAFVQYFVIITDYGFSITATKEISLSQHEHSRIHEIFSSVMTVKLALSFLSLIVLGILVYCIPRFKSDWLVYMLSFGAVIGNTLFPVWFFQGTEKMKYIADLNIVGEIILAFLIICLVKEPRDYMLVPLINSSVLIVTGILAQYIVFKRFGVSFKIQGYKNVSQQLKTGWNLFISIVAINAYTTTRTFAVGLLTNNTMTGFYSIAEKMANVVQTFPLASFSQAIYPRLSNIYHKNKAKAFDIMRQIQQITVNISLICIPIIFIISPYLIRIVCGGDYPAVSSTFRLLLVAVFFISSNAFKVQFLLVCGKMYEYSRIHITMALIGLPLIVAFIYSFSYVGAALATIGIEAGIFTLTYLAVKKLKF
jgi:PST family polysaccharide transporter